MTIAELAQYYDRETLALQIRYCKAAGRHRDLARLLEAQRLQTILIIGGSEGNEALRRSPQYAEAYEKYCWFRLMLDPPVPRQSKPRKQVQASPRAARPMRRVSKIMESLARKIAAQTNVNEPGAKAPGVSDATQSIENQKTPTVHNHGEPNIHELRIVKSRDDVGTHVGRQMPARALRMALMSHLVSLDRDVGTHPALSGRAYRRDIGTHPALPTSPRLRRTGSGRAQTCFATGLGGDCLRAA